MKKHIILFITFIIIVFSLTIVTINYVNSGKMVGNKSYKIFEEKVLNDLNLDIYAIKDKRSLIEKSKDYILGKEVKYYSVNFNDVNIKEFEIKKVSYNKNIIIDIKKIFNDGSYEITNIKNKLLNKKNEINIDKVTEFTKENDLIVEKLYIENNINGKVKRIVEKNSNPLFFEEYMLKNGEISTIITQVYSNGDVLNINSKNNTAIAIYSNGDKEEFLNFIGNLSLENKSGDSIYHFQNGTIENRKY